MRTTYTILRRLAVVAAVMSVLAACAAGGAEPEAGDGADDADEAANEEPAGPLTVYSGRTEELVGPVLDGFTDATGIAVQVRYGDTAELAATILEEGERSPADVYIAQDAGALGALSAEGRLARLPDAVLDRVEPRFRATDDTWVGVSGRARTLIYDTETLSRADLPDSVFDLTDEQWRGRVGWAPTNGSFQAFVTALRVEEGDEVAREWLEGMIANDAQVYENNTAIVEAAGRGEVQVGLVNHYYLYRFLAEDPSFSADNAFLSGDIGGLVNVAGAGVLTSTEEPAAAGALIEYLLSDDAQRHFSEETFEYPLAVGIAADDRLPPLDELETPDIDLSDLEDLRGTLELLRQVGALM